jgi:DNA-binding GntR family transcriptional regulator
VGLTGSPRLVALAESLTAEIRLALAKVDRIRRNLTSQVHSHQSLVDVLESGDVEAAAAELARHLRDAETSMLDALQLNAPQ